MSQRLESIPGIGFITATALAATVGDARAFRSGRQFAAWLGLVPRQNSSGGKDRMGGVSKMGDRYLRHLLVVGATAIIRHTKRQATAVSIWANRLLERKPARLPRRAIGPQLAAARLRHITGTLWSAKRYLNMNLLRQRMLTTQTA